VKRADPLRSPRDLGFPHPARTPSHEAAANPRPGIRQRLGDAYEASVTLGYRGPPRPNRRPPPSSLCSSAIWASPRQPRTSPRARPPQCCVASAPVEAGVRTGGCLCGAVRYSVRGDPVHVRRCHCANCRKESGSAFTVYAHWLVEAFEMSGEISSYDGRGFCPRCGSRLLDTADPDDTHVEIRIGSLDEAPFELKPEDEIWVKRRESWIPPVEGAAQHDERAS
jgi:hypothetical protein